MALPKKADYLIIGAGVHGLSTAYHLAKYRKAQGKGGGENIVVLDKQAIAAGASGVACGNVRCNYFQTPMTHLMIHCIDQWEKDPDFYAYEPVGYLTASFAPMREGLEDIHRRHRELGYPSTLVTGEKEVARYMKGIFHDWRATKLEAVLHEHRGGHAWNKQAIHGLAIKAEREDVQIVTGPEVTGFKMDSQKNVKLVETDYGGIEVGHVIVAAGPWVANFWKMMDLPQEVKDPKNPSQQTALWHYLALQEGQIELNPYTHITNDGKRPPLIHVDSSEPLHGPDGKLVWDKPWGIYFKRDKTAIQGGAVPKDVGTECELDPYGTKSPHYCVKDDFYDLWCASLSHCMERYENVRPLASSHPSGGVGAFSADNFPIFDFMSPNTYVIADSNHGFKMLGVGEQVAEILTGGDGKLLKPFDFKRFEEGRPIPQSEAPFPWM